MTADTTRPIRPRPAPADDDASDAEDLAGEASRPRYTMWAGGIAATALVALALWGGAHLSVLLPGMRPAWLAGIVGVLLAWLVVAVLGWCAAELLKTHHRAMRAAAWRGTRRGGAWAWRTGRHHGGRAVVWAGGRWQRRQAGGEPCPSCGAGPGEQCSDGCAWRTEPCPICHAPAGEACASRCSGGRPGGIADDDMCQRIADAIRKGWECEPFRVVPSAAERLYEADVPAAVLELPGEANPAGLTIDFAGEMLTRQLGIPSRIVNVRRWGDVERAELLIPCEPPGPPPAVVTGGTQDPADTPVPAETQGNGDTPMNAPAHAVAHREAAPSRWGAAIDDTADLDPGSDTELLEHMSEEVAGMLGYGEALTELHETCVSGVRVDPVAMECVHDCADAIAEAAGVMAQAINRFKDVLERPRDFVADGGVLPKDGDWITGEDES